MQHAPLDELRDEQKAGAGWRQTTGLRTALIWGPPSAVGFRIVCQVNTADRTCCLENGLINSAILMYCVCHVAEKMKFILIY
jgi:hypothetical protein